MEKIPDNTDDIKTSKDIPSWKRMCYCILKNDHICRSMGFGLNRQQQKAIDMIKQFPYGFFLQSPSLFMPKSYGSVELFHIIVP